MSAEEVATYSVVSVNTTDLFEKNVPKSNGLYDLRMGTLTKNYDCQTCNCDFVNCPGHFGHIELTEPMFNPSFIKTVVKVLNCVCVRCSSLLVAPSTSYKRSSMKFKAVHDACKKTTSCPGCSFVQPRIVLDNWLLYFQFSEPDTNVVTKTQVSARRVFHILRKISDDTVSQMGMNPSFSHPKNMIISNLLVPPPVVRPSVVVDGNSRTQDDLTLKLCEIIKANANLLTGDSEEAKVQLQYHINTYMDNELPGTSQATQRTGRPIKSICQRIRTKEGRVRGNLMGKRVDYSARTVITAEPNISLDELGVPVVIARNLSVSETATSFNIETLQSCVDNGESPSSYKAVGAKGVWNSETSTFKDLRFARNVRVQIGDVVERHLRDGDVVVFNRQPTLHRMSMMGHRVKVMTGSTFRLNLSATTPYNADFDGDEMNLHVPCSLEAKAEVKELMMVPSNIVSPQSNKPVMGVVQDALLACRLLSTRDEFLTKEDFTNLMLHVGATSLPPPAILKPQALWSGKQLFNLIFPKIHCHQYAGWHDDNDTPMFSEADTEFYLDHEGTYISGTLCKKTIGPASNGLIHKIWLYDGHQAANRFVSNIQFLANNWLHERGFSMGIKDCVNSPSVDKQVREFIDDSLVKVREEDTNNESGVNRILNSARDRSGKYITDRMTSKNNLFNMTSGGSKGSVINIAQVMACVGQQNVNGARIGNGYTDRTLPHFPRNESGYDSKGFVKHSYMNGLTPTEFFFHAMGGREGVIDTAIKTSETGYIQRRLVKAMEDVVVAYDKTVRNSLGDILQFSYGEDGFDGSWLISQQSGCKRVHLPFDLDLMVRSIDSITMNGSIVASDDSISRSLVEFECNRLVHEALIRTARSRRWTEYQLGMFVSLVRERVQRAIVSPGEMVGIIAAQSLGQPITQMTLNTFHAAGISSQNLTMGVPRLKELINLSKNLKSPCMTIGLSRPVHPNWFVRLFLLDLSNRVQVYDSLPFEPNELEYVDLVGLSECEPGRCAKLEINDVLLDEHGLSMLNVTCSIFKYSELVWCSSFHNTIYIRCLDDTVFETKEEFIVYINKLQNEVHIKGIKEVTAMFSDDHDSNKVHTTGTNLSTVLSDPCVIPFKTYSNDVMEMYTQFGVEAARQTLLLEIKRVIEYDGSYLNYRHLSVLLDVMTYRGRVMAITRHGINRTETGVLMRCSFEETVNIILDATVYAETDQLIGVTENIIMGKMARVGTGCVDLMTNMWENTESTDMPLYSPPSPREKVEYVRTYFPLKEGIS